MGDTYVERLIKSQSICTLHFERIIPTDRMGPWREQNVVLTWEGEDTNNEKVSLTPNEAEVLYTKGLTRNIVRDEDEKLCIRGIDDVVLQFDGAIVCGNLSPRTNLRQEIFDYAKKMGYITATMSPVKMLSGTKSLIFNGDGSYSIFFEWHDSILKKFNQELLDGFTKYFFSQYSFGNLQVKTNGLLIENLSEDEVFFDRNIDILRKYDIQLFYLNPEFDKKLLLRALMNIAHMQTNSMSNLFYEFMKGIRFKKTGDFEIPENRQEDLNLSSNEFRGIHKMNCGVLYYNYCHYCDYKDYNYKYKIRVPYTEYIRSLLMSMQGRLKAECGFGKYADVYFYPYDQEIDIRCHGTYTSNIERELISMDYALTFLSNEGHFYRAQTYDAIISLLEADSSGYLRDEYLSYLKVLY